MSIVIVSLSGLVAVALLIYYISAKSARKTKYYKALKSTLSRSPDVPMIQTIVGFDVWLKMLSEIREEDPQAYKDASRMYEEYKPNIHKLHHNMSKVLLQY